MVMLHKELSVESIRLREQYWKAVEEPDRKVSVEKRWQKVMQLKRQFNRSLGD